VGQAAALGAAAQYQHCATGPLGLGSGHGAPCVGEVVTGGGDPWGGDVLRHRSEHVVGVGHPKGVGDHAAPGATGESEPEGGQGGNNRDCAFVGSPAAVPTSGSHHVHTV